MKTAERQISFSLALGWGVGTLGISVMFNTTNFLLLRFMTDFLGIAAATGGLILLTSKIYDTVTDPVMGIISDKTRSRWGRRRPYIFVGGIICALSFYALFHAPSLEETSAAVLIMLLFSLLYSTGYTIFNVPYMAMPAEMSNDYHERSYLVQFRVYAIAIGTLLGGFAAPFLVQNLGGGRDGHGAMSVILALVILTTSIVCFFATKNARATEREAVSHLPVREQFGILLQNKPFFLLISVKFFQLFALAVGQAVMAYFVVQILGRDYEFLGTYVLCSSVMIFASTPFWLWVSRQRGKVFVYVAASAIYALIAISWFFASSDNPDWQFYLRGLIAGTGSGGMLLMGQAMLPDTIAYDAVRSGMKREGVFAGIYTSAEKLAFAIGAAISGIFLGAMGYVESTSGSVAQPDSALFAIRLSVSVLPMILTIISCLFLIPYDLDEEAIAAQEKASA